MDWLEGGWKVAGVAFAVTLVAEFVILWRLGQL